jgi:hypothetical protein
MCCIYVSVNIVDLGAPMANTSMFVVLLVELKTILFHYGFYCVSCFFFDIFIYLRVTF